MYGIIVRYACYDNAGENETFEQLWENNLLTKSNDVSPFPHFWEGKEKFLDCFAKIWQNVHNDPPK